MNRDRSRIGARPLWRTTTVITGTSDTIIQREASTVTGYAKRGNKPAKVRANDVPVWTSARPSLEDITRRGNRICNLDAIPSE